MYMLSDNIKKEIENFQTPFTHQLVELFKYMF